METWSKEELDYLLSACPSGDTRRLPLVSNRLGRSLESCTEQLGLHLKHSWSGEDIQTLLSLCEKHTDLIHIASLLGRTVEDCSDRLGLLGWKCKEVFTISGEMLVKVSIVCPYERSSFLREGVVFQEIRKKTRASVQYTEFSDVSYFVIRVSAYELLGGSSPTREALEILLPLCKQQQVPGVHSVRFVLKKSRDSILDEKEFKDCELQVFKTESQTTDDLAIQISGKDSEFNRTFWIVFGLLRRWFFRGLPIPKKDKPLQRSMKKPLQRSMKKPLLSSEDSSFGSEDFNLFYQAALDSQPYSEARPPDGALAIKLLRHQRIALAWMLQKETMGCPCFGGILADDQGLGKTVSTIALIVTEEQHHDEMERRPAGGTLIVCPSSLMKQWADELGSKVNSSKNLSVLIYHGSSRSEDSEELAKYDVVITTYGLVTTAGPLAEVVWFRVVLDEAQTIKNSKSQKAIACYGLHAKRRWCLSGTPIQNSISDLYSYFRFIKCAPYSSYRVFSDMIKKPITKNPVEGYKKLQAILKTVMLRRTKGTMLMGEPIISLPPKTIELRKVEFSKEERAFYTELECKAREQYMEYTLAGTVKKNSAQVLSLLTSLRQACNHPLLVSSSPQTSAAEVAKNLSFGSSKIKAALEILLNDLNQSSDVLVKRVEEKAIVFSQWTKMLDLLEEGLESTSIKYRRFDGSMSIEARDKAIKDFSTLPEVTVMIMSLMTASVGLNLVAASRVLLLELWWNPTTEDQAIDRAHRIGQTLPVKVIRLTVKNTVEDRMLTLQEKKRTMVAHAFCEGEKGCGQTSFSEEDLNYLLGC